MKTIILVAMMAAASIPVLAQEYPDPEFSNEVYFLKKDSGYSLVRLEKGISRMDTKAKLGGFGGSEASYNLEGSRSTARVSGGSQLSFVYSNGTAKKANPSRDSMMRANGMDPSMADGFGFGMDPSQNLVLYRADGGKGKRKIMMQKSPGAFGSKKLSSADKYSFSLKKIRDGYWELVIDKPLPRGEYAFSAVNTMSGSDGSMTFFSFGVE